jgi:hypothetical protein
MYGYGVRPSDVVQQKDEKVKEMKRLAANDARRQARQRKKRQNEKRAEDTERE